MFAAEFNGNLHINANLAQRIAKILVSKLSIGRAIDHHHQAASAFYHLIEAQVLEVSTIREINIGTGVIGQPKGLSHQGVHSRVWTFMPPGIFAGIAGISQPCSKAGIEKGHNEAHQRR